MQVPVSVVPVTAGVVVAAPSAKVAAVVSFAQYVFLLSASVRVCVPVNATPVSGKDQVPLGSSRLPMAPSPAAGDGTNPFTPPEPLSGV